MLAFSLSNLGRSYFGPGVPCKTVRKCFEPSDPTTQCNAIIGPFIQGIPCYICGMEIHGSVSASENCNNNNNKARAGAGTEQTGGYPECEHILPIAQAVILLGLYSPQFIDKPVFNPKVLKYEYAWAHKTCNREKKDHLYITNDDAGNFVLDVHNLDELLKKIWNTSRQDSKTFKETLHKRYKTLSHFKSARLGILSSKFQNICDFLNSFGANKFLLLAGVCKVMSGELMSETGRQLLAKADPDVLLKQESEKKQKMLKSIENEYIKIANNVITEMTKLVKPQIIEIIKPIYNEKVEKEWPYYRDLTIFINIDNRDLFKQWTTYVKNNLTYIMFTIIESITGLNRHLGNRKKALESIIFNVTFTPIMKSLRESGTSVADATAAAVAGAGAAAASMGAAGAGAAAATLAENSAKYFINEKEYMRKSTEMFLEIAAAADKLLALKANRRMNVEAAAAADGAVSASMEEEGLASSANVSMLSSLPSKSRKSQKNRGRQLSRSTKKQRRKHREAAPGRKYKPSIRISIRSLPKNVQKSLLSKPVQGRTHTRKSKKLSRI